MASTSGVLRVSSLSASQNGTYCSERSHSGSIGKFSWNEKELSFQSDESASTVAVPTVLWDHVSAVWASVRSHKGRGFQLELTMETSRGGCSVDFLSVQAPMDGVAGTFLDFLQTNVPERVKDGRAPQFATSRWATPVYRQGFTARTVRLTLSRLNLFFELLFAVCFFAQLEKIFWSREAKFVGALTDLVQDLRNCYREVMQMLIAEINTVSITTMLNIGLVAVPMPLFRAGYRFTRHMSNWVMLILLLQHLMTVLVTLRSLVSTLKGLIASVRTVHTMATKARDQVKKGTTPSKQTSVSLSGEAKADDPPPQSTLPSTDTTEGDLPDGLRQRKQAE